MKITTDPAAIRLVRGEQLYTLKGSKPFVKA